MLLRALFPLARRSDRVPYARRMTMLSVRVADAEADEARRWAEALGVDRSELLRDALHAHLVRLRSEIDASRWQQSPSTDAEFPCLRSQTGDRLRSGRLERCPGGRPSHAASGS